MENKNPSEIIENIVVFVLMILLITVFVFGVIFVWKTIYNSAYHSSHCKTYYEYTTLDDEIDIAEKCISSFGILYCGNDNYVIQVKEIRKLERCE